MHQTKTNNVPNFRVIDFFCGGGGITCGLRLAGINVVVGVVLTRI